MSSGHYLSLPPSGHGPGVLLLHEAWGLTPDMVWAAERLARYGFVTLAPDLTPSMGGKLGSVRQIIAGQGDLLDHAIASLNTLHRRREVTSPRIAVVGFSMGAALSLFLAEDRRVGAIGFNYGLISPKARLDATAPIVASFGGNDRLLPRSDRPLRQRIEGRAGRHDIEVYKGAGHSFMTPTADASSRIRCLLSSGFDEDTADRAWERLCAHLSRHVTVDHRLRR